MNKDSTVINVHLEAERMTTFVYRDATELNSTLKNCISYLKLGKKYHSNKKGLRSDTKFMKGLPPWWRKNDKSCKKKKKVTSFDLCAIQKLGLAEQYEVKVTLFFWTDHRIDCKNVDNEVKFSIPLERWYVALCMCQIFRYFVTQSTRHIWK